MSDLRKKTGAALVWDLFGNYGGQIIGFAISIFLARLLDPAEFGLVGMSMVFIALLQVFMDMGFASALIQAKNEELSSLTYSSVFYLNIFAGAVLTLLLFLAAPLIGDFYGEDQVTKLVRLLSIVFFIGSFNIVQSTILRKELNFKILTLRTLISQFIGGIVAVYLAWKGYGVYSLVIQQIVSAVIRTALLWKITDWYPRLEFSMQEVKKLTGFSAYVFAAQGINQLVTRADTLMVGKLFSPATLGFYARANSLNNLIIKNSVSSISKVFFPAMSSIQDQEERFVAIYLKSIEMVAGISIFLTGVFYLAGEELIIGFFGKKWEPSVLMFEILVIKGFTFPISSMIVNVFMAKGKSKEDFHYGNIRKTLRLVPFGIAYFYGFYPFLYSMVGVSLISWSLNNFFVSRTLKISLAKQFKAVLPNLFYAVILVLMIDWLFPSGINYFLAFIEIALFVLIFGAILYFTNSVLIKELKFYFDKFLFKKKK